MITGKLTNRGRTTIPQAVREALGLKAGEGAAYTIMGDHAVMARVRAEDPFATFVEWNTEADRRAYADL